MVNPRKAYPVDPSLIPYSDRSGKTNLGHVLETAVALQLERLGARQPMFGTNPEAKWIFSPDTMRDVKN